jgi:hypothetical protein
MGESWRHLIVEAPVPVPPRPGEVLHQLRWAVYRLALSTQVAAVDSGVRRPGRRPVTLDPLVTVLRDAVRPNQGGTGSGAGGGGRIGFDAAAFELLELLTTEISAVFVSTVNRVAVGTLEQLLMEWFAEIEHRHRTGAITLEVLVASRDRARGWRRRVDDLLTPPQTREGQLCPRCGWTHRLVLMDGQAVMQRTLVTRTWPEIARRDPMAECRYCGAQWVGWEELRALADELAANVEHYGPIDTTEIAPLPDPTVTIHLAPPSPSDPTPCCERLLTDLPEADIITRDRVAATCPDLTLPTTRTEGTTS